MEGWKVVEGQKSGRIIDKAIRILSQKDSECSFSFYGREYELTSFHAGEDCMILYDTTDARTYNTGGKMSEDYEFVARLEHYYKYN